MLPSPLYCDTSALLKLYVREAGSEEFNAITAGRTDVFVSQLALTEVVSALARRRRQGRLGDEAVQRIRRTIMRSIEEGIYQHVT